MASYDSLIIGEIAEDTNVDYDGTVVHAVGGAVYYSGFAAANIGHKIAVLPKADTAKIDLKAAFAKATNITVYPLHSRNSFVTKNVYHTPDRERRTSTVDSAIDRIGRKKFRRRSMPKFAFGRLDPGGYSRRDDSLCGAARNGGCGRPNHDPLSGKRRNGVP